jgi:hypothetical protein
MAVIGKYFDLKRRGSLSQNPGALPQTPHRRGQQLREKRKSNPTAPVHMILAPRQK